MSQSLADKLKLKITGKLTPKTDEPAPVKKKKEKKKKEPSDFAGLAVAVFQEASLPIPAKEPKPLDAPKQAQDKPRTCCGTKRGKDVPHDVKCHTLVGKKKLHIGFDLPGGRFPVGTKMDKTYHEGGFWECVLVIGGVSPIFHANDGNALQVEWKVTKKYIAWLKENAAAPVVPEVQ